MNLHTFHNYVLCMYIYECMCMCVQRPEEGVDSCCMWLSLSWTTAILVNSAVGVLQRLSQLGLLTVYFSSQKGRECHQTLTWASSCFLPPVVCSSALIAHGLWEGLEYIVWEGWGSVSIYVAVREPSSLLGKDFLVLSFQEDAPTPPTNALKESLINKRLGFPEWTNHGGVVPQSVVGTLVEGGHYLCLS